MENLRKTQYWESRGTSPLLASQKHSAVMREMSRKKVRPLHSDRMQAFVTKTAEKALSESFQTDFELLKNGLKNNSYVCTEHMLTKTAHCGGLFDLFDQSVKRRIQPFLLWTSLHVEPQHLPGLLVL